MHGHAWLFHMGAEGPNSEPHACVTSVWQAEPTPRALLGNLTEVNFSL